jgi:gluconate 2-dehydrogenase gamma chain
MSRPIRRECPNAAGGAAAAAPAAREARVQPRPADGDAKAGRPKAAKSTRHGWMFFNPAEAAFVRSAVARLMPADDAGAGATVAAVATFIDRQLADASGADEPMLGHGPSRAGEPPADGQRPCTPAGLFRAAFRAYDEDLRMRHGRGFEALPPDVQDRELAALETAAADLDGMPASTFFDVLLAMTIEGFWSDRGDGGQGDVVGWSIIGLGAHANFYTYVGPQSVEFLHEPTSLAGDAEGIVHVQPPLPASAPGAATKPRGPR